MHMLDKKLAQAAAKRVKGLKFPFVIFNRADMREKFHLSGALPPCAIKTAATSIFPAH
jgi:hypothetical protein